MKGSTVGDIITSGHDSGQWSRSGLYTAKGAQFMIGSCHTINVVHRNMSMTGLPGLRRQPMTNMTTSCTSIRAVPIWTTNIQWSNPKRASTGRGLPSVLGLATRGSSAVRETATKVATNASSAKAPIHRAHRMSDFVGPSGGGCFCSSNGVDSSAVTRSFLPEAVDEMRVDAVGIERAG